MTSLPDHGVSASSRRLGEKPRHVFFSAGEPSGDEHAAALLAQLRQQCPGLKASGLGGPRLAQAGCELLADMTPLAVMWFARALWHLPTFYRLFRRARAHLQTQRPDAVVLVDYPGFNWHVARAAHELGIPTFYYCPPQVWGWAQHRVRKMRRWVDHVLCCLPFEQQWYSRQGCRAVWIGHPYFDHVAGAAADRQLIERLQSQGPVVALLPGSRIQEVKQNLPWLLDAADKLHAQMPQVHLVAAAYGPRHAELIGRQVAERPGLPVTVVTGRTLDVIRAARVALAVSGSVSLELLYCQVPTVVFYRVSPLAWWVQHRVKRVRYITLVNLLASPDPFLQAPFTYDPEAPGAEEVPFPEYLTWRSPARAAAARVLDWLQQPELYERQRRWLARLKEQYAQTGACRRAAEYILQALSGTAECRREQRAA